MGGLNRLRIPLFIVLLLLFSGSYAEPNALFTIYPGASIRSITVNMTRIQDGQEASLTDSPGTFSTNINMKFKDFDFPGTRWGYTTFAHIGLIDTHSQFVGVDGDEVKIVDVSTRSSGNYAYVIPAIYYRPEDMNISKDVVVTMGLGLGYGNLNVSGQAKFGPDREITGAAVSTDFSMSAVDSLALTTFYNIAFENRSNFRVSVTHIMFSDKNYKADMSEFSLSYNYAIVLF